MKTFIFLVILLNIVLIALIIESLLIPKGYVLLSSFIIVFYLIVIITLIFSIVNYIFNLIGDYESSIPDDVGSLSKLHILYLIIFRPKYGYPVSEFDIRSMICNFIGLLISIILFQLKVLNNYNNITYCDIIIPIWILSSIGNVIHIFGIIDRIRKPDCCKLSLAIMLPSINIYTICIFLTLLAYYFDNINSVTIYSPVICLIPLSLHFIILLIFSLHFSIKLIKNLCKQRFIRRGNSLLYENYYDYAPYRNRLKVVIFILMNLFGLILQLICLFSIILLWIKAANYNITKKLNLSFNLLVLLIIESQLLYGCVIELYLKNYIDPYDYRI